MSFAGIHTSLRKYCLASSVCKASLDGHWGSSCSFRASRSPDMNETRGQGGVKSMSLGGLSSPSAHPGVMTECEKFYMVHVAAQGQHATQWHGLAGKHCIMTDMKYWTITIKATCVRS